MLSFFGDDDDKPSTSKGAIIKRVMVKKPPPPTRPPIPKSNSTEQRPSSHSQSHTSSSSSKLKSSHHSSSKPTNKHLSTTPSTSSSRHPTPSSPVPKKRKNTEYQPIRPESPSGSELSGSEDDDELFGGSNGIPKSSSSSKRMRTGSAIPKEDEGVGRDIFCYGRVDRRGDWGRGWGSYVECEEVVRGKDGKMLDKYEAYFPQDGFGKDGPLPFVELQYPAPGCREKFILLKPTSHREYSPIDELMRAVKTIVKHYIPPTHAHIFGHFSDPLRDDLLPSTLPSRVSSPFPNALATPPPDPSTIIPNSNTASSIPIHTPQEETIARSLEKSLARNIRDGPGFVKAMERFNEALEGLQSSGEMGKWLETSGRGIKSGEWSELVETVHEQAYNRVVGPYSHELEHHPKHSDEVANAISEKEDAYGELRHNFMSKIISQTSLGPGSVFVDLGSGVGNCVLQASLQAGCKSYGFELLPVPAKCARLQVAEVRRRWAMWCLEGCLEVETHEGDFRVHPEVAKRLREADVVLVNNEVFPESLNHDLTNQFLDLKEGARIVSLKPFIQEGFRLKENNYGSFSALLRTSTQTYNQGWVSWKGESGKYHIQTIDRRMVKKFMEEMGGGGRSRK